MLVFAAIVPGVIRVEGQAGVKPQSLSINIRPARPDDATALWSILEPVIRAGETYTLERTMSETDALAYWMSSDKETFVAEDRGAIIGTYYMRPNQAGGGAHICNCGFMTSQGFTGKGVARTMCLHALEHARAQGYRGMQFNFVVSTNHRAIRLWTSLGFKTAGTLPKAFAHPLDGFVDALVMFRAL